MCRAAAGEPGGEQPSARISSSSRSHKACEGTGVCGPHGGTAAGRRCFPLQQQLRGLPGRLCVCRVEAFSAGVSVPVYGAGAGTTPRAAAACAGFLTAVEDRSPKSRCGQHWFFLRAEQEGSVASFSHCKVTFSLSLISMFFLYASLCSHSTSHTGLGPTLLTSL